MYSKKEAALLRKNFWTSFGQYMGPLPGADGETVTWMNYKTGIRHIYFRMDADNKTASIAIELRHTEPGLQKKYFKKFEVLKTLLHQTAGEEWQWQLHTRDEDGKLVSRIVMVLNGVNLFHKDDWPAIISFLKPRMLALDTFWSLVKENFE